MIDYKPALKEIKSIIVIIDYCDSLFRVSKSS